MPTREEIAVWLREAAILDLSETSSVYWNQRAAKVEGMRCKTCKHYELPYTESRTYDSIPDKCASNQIRGQGKDFGCFHHEPKDKK